MKKIIVFKLLLVLTVFFEINTSQQPILRTVQDHETALSLIALSLPHNSISNNQHKSEETISPSLNASYGEDSDENSDEDSHENSDEKSEVSFESKRKKIADDSSVAVNKLNQKKKVVSPFSCSSDGCRKTFVTNTELIKHEALHLLDEQEFGCGQCSKSFSTQKKLDDHVKLHGEKNFICGINGCDVKYAKKNTLNMHIKSIHSAVSLTCSIDGCTYSCSTAENLGRHQVRAHKLVPEGRKVLFCNSCDYEKPFVCSSALIKHQKTKKHLRYISAIAKENVEGSQSL